MSARAAAKAHSDELRTARADAASSKAEAKSLAEKASQLEKRAKVLFTCSFSRSAAV
jgi:hypothetical protein